MELIEVNAFQAQALQAAFQRLAQMFRAAIGHPFIRSGACIAALAGNDQSLWIGIERLGNQIFADFRTIGISRIDKVDAQFNGPPQHGQRFCFVLWWPPYTWPRESHGAKAQTIDVEITAEFQHTTGGNWRGLLHHRMPLSGENIVTCALVCTRRTKARMISPPP